MNSFIISLKESNKCIHEGESIQLMAKGEHGSIGDLLQELEFGFMIAGFLFIVLGLFGLLGYIRKLFTPVVTGTFLVLLSLQISKSLIEGVLGIGFRNDGTVSPEITIQCLV